MATTTKKRGKRGPYKKPVAESRTPDYEGKPGPKPSIDLPRKRSIELGQRHRDIIAEWMRFRGLTSASKSVREMIEFADYHAARWPVPTSGANEVPRRLEPPKRVKRKTQKSAFCRAGSR